MGEVMGFDLIIMKTWYLSSRAVFFAVGINLVSADLQPFVAIRVGASIRTRN